MHHLKDENGNSNHWVEIANMLGEAIEKSSSYYSKLPIQKEKEKQKVNFKTNRNLCYSKKLTPGDLKWSLTIFQ